MAHCTGAGLDRQFDVESGSDGAVVDHRTYLVQTLGAMIMDSDKAFFGTILAMMALLFGYPVAAFFIFLIAVLA